MTEATAIAEAATEQLDGALRGSLRSLNLALLNLALLELSGALTVLGDPAGRSRPSGTAGGTAAASV